MVPLQLDLFLRIAESLHNREMVQRYLQLLVSLGYHLRVLREENVSDNAAPEISLMAQQALEAYLTRQQANLHLHASYLGRLRIEMWITFNSEEGILSFSVDHEHFNGSDEGRAAFGALVEMFKATYAYWHPFYGYEWYDGEPKAARVALLVTYDIHHLFSINFLGPEIVEKIGRERILSAPAWRNELLDDGGVLLIPDNVYGSHIPFAYKRLALALGLQTPQDEGEEWFEDIYDDPALW